MCILERLAVMQKNYKLLLLVKPEVLVLGSDVIFGNLESYFRQSHLKLIQIASSIKQKYTITDTMRSSEIFTMHLMGNIFIV
jgi:hypothetical protein